MDRYAPLVDCFSIGQEPSAYPKNKPGTSAGPTPAPEEGDTSKKVQYDSYRAEWKKFADAIIAAVPSVKFCGPCVHNNADWAKRFMADFGRGHHVSLIVEHLYAGGSGNKVPTPEIGRQRMLPSDFTT